MHETRSFIVSAQKTAVTMAVLCGGQFWSYDFTRVNAPALVYNIRERSTSTFVLIFMEIKIDCGVFTDNVYF
jgi:hypothetical protein